MKNQILNATCHINIYIYVYIWVCVSVCNEGVCILKWLLVSSSIVNSSGILYFDQWSWIHVATDWPIGLQAATATAHSISISIASPINFTITLSFGFNIADYGLLMHSCWTPATIRACPQRRRRRALWSMSLMVSGLPVSNSFILFFSLSFFPTLLHLLSFSLFVQSIDESPAAMQKSGGNGSCLRSSVNFGLVLALAASAVVRWMRWLLGSGNLSLVHINCDVRQSISSSFRQQQQQQQLQQLQQDPKTSW